MNKNKIIHVITGDGKGKTTAALGLALRAIGASKKVLIIQFMKKPDFSEHEAIKKSNLPINVETFGIGFYKILGDAHTAEEHKRACQKALDRAKEAIESNSYDLIVLDEINVALGFDLININDVISMLKAKTHKLKPLDIVLTGRRADPKLIKLADLVSEIKEIKHYFNAGLDARKGIEY